MDIKKGVIVAGSNPTIVRSYKAAVTKQIHQISGLGESPAWQRGYHDHIIRNDADYERIATYILNNPLEWELDSFW